MQGAWLPGRHLDLGQTILFFSGILPPCRGRGRLGCFVTQIYTSSAQGMLLMAFACNAKPTCVIAGVRLI